MRNKTNYLFKNMGILTVSNFASKILIFLLVPLYTSVLSTAEYGSYDIAISTATLFYPILTLDIADAVMRFSMDESYSRDKIVKIGVKYLFLSIIAFALGMILLRRFCLWPDIHGLEIYIFLYYLFYAINQFLIQIAKGLEQVKIMGIAGVISTIITVVLNIIFLLVLECGLSGFFYANILAQAFGSFYLAIKLRLWQYIKKTETDKVIAKEMLAYSIPLIATTVGWWVNSTADKYVVALMLGVSSNGLLSISYKVPQIINTLQGIFIQAWQISAIKEYGEEDTAKFYGDVFLFVNFLMCEVCSFLILINRPLAHILFSDEFYNAWRYVPFLLVSCVLNSASGMIGPILSAKKDSKSMMWSAIIGSVSNIVLNVVFVYLIGIQGATIATVICSFVIYFVRKKAAVEDIKISGYGIVIATWILLFVQGTIEIYRISYWLEIVILIIVQVTNRNTIKITFNMCREIVDEIKKIKSNV